MNFSVCTRVKELTSFKGLFWVSCSRTDGSSLENALWSGYLNKKGRILGNANPSNSNTNNLSKDRNSAWYNGERTAVASIIRYCKKNGIQNFNIQFEYKFGE